MGPMEKWKSPVRDQLEPWYIELYVNEKWFTFFKLLKHQSHYQQPHSWTLFALFLPWECTVKLVLSGHSKIDKIKVLKTNCSLMKFESIAECYTFDLHLARIGLENKVFVFIVSGRLRQVLLYFTIWATTCKFQQCGILTSVDSDNPLQPLLKLRNSKWCLVCSLTVIEYSSDKQRFWSETLFGLLLYVSRQQLWSLRDGQFT